MTMTRREANRDMSSGLSILHSHSGLERELKLPKHIVVVDSCFINLFADAKVQGFMHNGVSYYKVPVDAFIRNGGLFKNLMG